MIASSGRMAKLTFSILANSVICPCPLCGVILGEKCFFLFDTHLQRLSAKPCLMKCSSLEITKKPVNDGKHRHNGV